MNSNDNHEDRQEVPFTLSDWWSEGFLYEEEIAGSTYTINSWEDASKATGMSSKEEMWKNPQGTAQLMG